VENPDGDTRSWERSERGEDYSSGEGQDECCSDEVLREQGSELRIDEGRRFPS